ncbi:MAG TPA: ribonuclease III [Victivallales bacterium]|nr:ribonuclease III [Victivallales bacterium]
MKEVLSKLESKINYSFKNKTYLKQALTHRSYAAEKKIKNDNQRLEFLGDAVVEIIITEFLFILYPKKNEGELTALRSALVQKKSLSKLAKLIDLNNFIYLGKGEAGVNGGLRESTLCDTFEAVIGAVYMDSNLESSRKILIKLINKAYSNIDTLLVEINPKGYLQELVQKDSGSKPIYQLKSTGGLQHAPLYTVDVLLNNEVISTGTGQNIKSAEIDAAGKAIKILGEK